MRKTIMAIAFVLCATTAQAQSPERHVAAQQQFAADLGGQSEQIQVRLTELNLELVLMSLADGEYTAETWNRRIALGRQICDLHDRYADLGVFPKARRVVPEGERPANAFERHCPAFRQVEQ